MKEKCSRQNITAAGLERRFCLPFSGGCREFGPAQMTVSEHSPPVRVRSVR